MPELTDEELRGADERLLLDKPLRTELLLLREPLETVLRLCDTELLPRETELLLLLRETELLLPREAELPGA